MNTETTLQTVLNEVRELKAMLVKLMPAEPVQPTKPEPEPEPVQPEPQPLPPTEPVSFAGNWITMGQEAMDKSATTNQGKPWTTNEAGVCVGKNNCIRDWTVAVGDAHANPSVPDLWVKILDSVKSRETTHKKGSISNFMSNIMSVARELRIPPDERPDGFKTYYELLETKVKLDTVCNKLAPEKLEAKLRLQDGKLLTTAYLREWCASTECTTDDQRFDRMFLTMCAYQGNRQQDYMVGYGENNKTERGYYCPETTRVVLFKGKTQTVPEREFKLHPTVAVAIHEYHSQLATPSPQLLPLIMDVKDTIKKVNKLIRRVFPTANALTHGDLRDLFETHIRWVDKLAKDEVNELMRQIGHSAITAWNHYAIKYSGILEMD